MDSSEFGVVAEAVLPGRMLEFDYHGRARDAKSHRRVHPQRLIHYRNNWYLAAHCETADDFRLFSLDRIRGATLLEREARRFSDDQLDRWLNASYGIFTGVAGQWAHLRFTSGAARWVAEERWHSDQVGCWEGGVYELQVPYAEPTELIMEVLRWGSDAEVVGPPDLRAEVGRRLLQAADKY